MNMKPATKATTKTSDPERLATLEAAVRTLTKDQRAALWKSMDTKIKREGTEIILPNTPVEMSYDEAIEVMKRVKAEEEQIFEVQEVIEGIPWDAAVCTYRAMQDIYGVVTSHTVQTFFGPNHPEFLTVNTGPTNGEVVQIPVGNLMFPNSKVMFKFGIIERGAYLTGKVNKRDRERLVQIATRAKELMATESIYRGKAISINAMANGQLDMSDQPTFIDLSNVSRGDIVHNRIAEELIDTNIFSPLENSDSCRKFGIPLKRGILLEGSYGTGKTLTALVTAKIATDNGWTFIMLNRCNALAAAVKFSQRIQPVAIFTEDMDRFADRANERVNDLVNTLDGLDTKSNEVLVVVTTNHIEKFDKSLLRPGRFDAVISLLPPDAETAQRLITKYAGENMESVDTDAKVEGMKRVGELIAGQVPASIREVVKRAHLANLQRGNETILVADLVTAASGMARHFELLAEQKGLPTKAEILHSSMTEVARTVVKEENGKQNAALKAIANRFDVKIEL